jgi:hypothetical protein
VKVIDRDRDKLILRYQRSIWQALAIGMLFCGSSLVVALMILLVQYERGGNPIFPVVIGGCLIFIGGVFAASWPLVVTFTFDRQQQQILWERQTLLNRTTPTSLTFPIHLIVGVELVTTSDIDAATGYYLNLILDRGYWRILLNSDGYERTAIAIAKEITEFLAVPYYPENSKAPLPIWQQKISQSADPHQFTWQYLATEIERLEQYVSAHPQAAAAHQELGIALYLSSRSHRRLALAHLQQAQQLFATDLDGDLAAITRVIHHSIDWS